MIRAAVATLGLHFTPALTDIRFILQESEFPARKCYSVEITIPGRGFGISSP